jgi:hypothetical protein
MKVEIIKNISFKPFSVVITFEREEELYNELFGFVHNFDKCSQGLGDYYHTLSKDEMCRKVRAAIKTKIETPEKDKI